MREKITGLVFQLSRLLGFIFRWIMPYAAVKLLRASGHIIHTTTIQSRFRRCGKNTFIEKPFHVRGEKYIAIGDNFMSNGGLRLDALHYLEQAPEIVIGNDVNINYDCHIGCVNKILIGNHVLIASKVYITDHAHGETDFESLKIPPRQRKIVSKGPVVIHDNVWIGEGAVIMPNVVIGENSVIGANAVVTKSVPPFSIATGVPAKILKSYTV